MSSASFALPRFASPALALTGSDRRRSTRWAVAGSATAVVCLTEAGDSRNRICPLSLIDVSDTGAGVISREAIPVGAHLSVFVMPDGAEAGYDLSGTVVRCAPREDRGHTIGVRLRNRLAA